MNPYFSKGSIVRLEPVIHERIGRLCERLQEAMCGSQVVDLDSAFAALTADVVTCYFYGAHFDYLRNAGFKFAMRNAILGLIGLYHWTRFLPAVASIVKKLPIPILRLIQPDAAALISSQKKIGKEIQDSLSDEASTKSKAVIVKALQDPSIPPEEKSIDRLVDEGTTIIFAGTETTARALSVAIFHLLNNKSLLENLRSELNTLPPTEDHAYTCAQLENLPYLVNHLNDAR